MASAPRSKGGYGKGGDGGASRVDQAAPIADPALLINYKDNVRRRDFAADTVFEREEARRAEAEERMLARKRGEEVDLGTAGQNWKRIADKTKPSSATKANSNAWDKWSEQKSSWRSNRGCCSEKNSISQAAPDTRANRIGKENQSWLLRNDRGKWNNHVVEEKQVYPHGDDEGWNNRRLAGTIDVSQRWQDNVGENSKMYISGDEQDPRDGTIWQNTGSTCSNSCEEQNHQPSPVERRPIYYSAGHYIMFQKALDCVARRRQYAKASEDFDPTSVFDNALIQQHAREFELAQKVAIFSDDEDL